MSSQPIYFNIVVASGPPLFVSWGGGGGKFISGIHSITHARMSTATF